LETIVRIFNLSHANKDESTRKEKKKKEMQKPQMSDNAMF
jgi:hypothetical protein